MLGWGASLPGALLFHCPSPHAGPPQGVKEMEQASPLEAREDSSAFWAPTPTPVGQMSPSFHLELVWVVLVDKVEDVVHLKVHHKVGLVGKHWVQFAGSAD